MIEDTLQNLYNPEYYNNEIGKYKTHIEINFILKEITLSDTKLRILDAGGGSGRISHLLSKLEFDNILLFDISEQHVLGAKKLGIDAHCVDFHDFHSAEQFDVIIANEITQFVGIHDLVSFAKKYLKINGLLIFVYLNPKSFRQLIKIFLNPSKRLQPSYLSPPILNSQMIKNGFKLKHSLGYMWQIVGGHSNSILVKFFAYFERTFQLHQWLNRSPWIISSYQRIANLNY